jgi:hypothetical protein
MLTAAQKGIFAAPGCASSERFFSLAAGEDLGKTTGVGKKTHQGSEQKNAALYPGQWVSKSRTAIGLVERGGKSAMGLGILANPQSLNRYAYVMNNPMNATDSLGLFDDDITDNDPFQLRPGCWPNCGKTPSGPLDPRNPPPAPWPIDPTGHSWGPGGHGPGGGTDDPGPPRLRRRPDCRATNTANRVIAGITGAGDLVFGGGKVLLAGGLGLAAPATFGLSGVAAVYLGLNGTGQTVSGTLSLGYAFTGDKGLEEGAHAVTAITTVSGFVTFLATGSVDRAAHVGSWENATTALVEAAAGPEEEMGKAIGKVAGEDASALLESAQTECVDH